MSIEFLGIAVLVLAAIAAGALISRHLRSTRRRSTGEVFDELFFDELFGDLVAQQKSTLSGGSFGAPQSVSFLAYGPEVVSPGADFILYIWAHAARQMSDFMALMPRLDAGARMLDVKTAVDVRAGTAISIEIVAPTLRVKQGSDTIVWRGEPA